MSGADPFAEYTAQWGETRVHIRLEDELPDPALTTNVRMMCFAPGGIVLITTAEFGPNALPGGTLLEGESLEAGLQRELAEEVGARATSWDVLARLVVRSDAERPYKPHFPHPVIHQALCAGAVEFIGSPTNPDDGETVTNVEVMPVEHALARLGAHDDGWFAAVTRWVAAAYVRARGMV